MQAYEQRAKVRSMAFQKYPKQTKGNNNNNKTGSGITRVVVPAATLVEAIAYAQHTGLNNRHKEPRRVGRNIMIEISSGQIPTQKGV